MGALHWIEQTRVSAFVREDFYAYFVLLILHAWGMAFLVGAGLATALRILGVASAAPIARFSGFFPIMWLGAALAIPSGVGLLLGYPAKALTNWVFAVKFACLIGATVLVVRAARQALAPVETSQVTTSVPASAKVMAAGSIALWLGGVAAGKLLLYTNHILLTTD